MMTARKNRYNIQPRTWTCPHCGFCITQVLLYQACGWNAFFASAISQKPLSFTNRVGGLAEAEGHHPAILTEWGQVTVTLWTHAI
jgi:hypothetical protein